MADLNENNEPGVSQVTGTEGGTTAEIVVENPGVQPQTPASTGPSPLEQRLAQAELASQQLLQQMILNDQVARSNQPQTPAGPDIPKDILEGATPIVKAVLREQLKEIADLKGAVSSILAENQGSKEKSFILKEVPDWEDVKGEVAKHIHAQLDALGIPQDPRVRVQYFTPTSVVMAANLIKAQRPREAQATSETLTGRSVVEGRGGGTTPGTASKTIDYTVMSDAEFAKYEAKIAAQRMARNHG